MAFLASVGWLIVSAITVCPRSRISRTRAASAGAANNDADRQFDRTRLRSIALSLSRDDWDLGDLTDKERDTRGVNSPVRRSKYMALAVYCETRACTANPPQHMQVTVEHLTSATKHRTDSPEFGLVLTMAAPAAPHSAFRTPTVQRLD
jgi:hypothetical protein